MLLAGRRRRQQKFFRYGDDELIQRVSPALDMYLLIQKMDEQDSSAFVLYAKARPPTCKTADDQTFSHEDCMNQLGPTVSPHW
jgi:hypothetical protein